MKILPLILAILLFGGYFGSKLKLPTDSDQSKETTFLADLKGERSSVYPKVTEFTELPIVYEGRLKPYDTLARNTLRVLADSESIYHVIDGKKRQIPVGIWLLDILSGNERGKGYRFFRIHNLELLEKLGLPNDESYKYKYTANEIYKEMDIEHKHDDGHSHKTTRRNFINEEAQIASNVDAKKRSVYENAVLRLAKQMNLYELLTISHISQEIPDEMAVLSYNQLSQFIGANSPRPIPTTNGEWDSIIFMNVRKFSSDELSAAWKAMHDMLEAWKNDNYSAFNKSLEIYQKAISENVIATRKFLEEKKAQIEKREANIDEELKGLTGKEYEEKKESILTWIFNSKKYLVDQNDLWGSALSKMPFERRFNSTDPFYISLIFYVLIFIICCFGLLIQKKFIWSLAINGFAITILIHTFAVWCRYYISGYPPVTNLYSSAVFIGWGVAVIGYVLEITYKRYFGMIASAIAGFACLFISVNLSGDGETMGTMVAVLDTKFWLATHVITVTLGYTATFLAGGIGIIWILSSLISGGVKEDDKSMIRSMYGVVCYGMFLSFVGTVLGGLWADDSWGRFWGWDPKENGALMIVLWNAVILHARWGGLVKDRGLAALAVFGNIITAWSWFGVNLLGVGLHSYGFTDSGLFYLLLFALIHLIFCVLCMIPFKVWNNKIDSTKEALPSENA
jgi:ABC-type transport system involved in cytochrome c biogenesis permease subunit